MLKYNLQFFAQDGPGGEKTEAATPKKLSDARKEGQVAKSKEIGNAAGMMLLFVILKVFIGTLGERLTGLFTSVYARIPELSTMSGGHVREQTFTVLIRQLLFDSLITMAPFLLGGLLVGVAIEVFQVRWEPTTKPLQPKLSKMNPINGFKKFFTLNSFVELVKSICKVVLIVWIAYDTLRDQSNLIFTLYDISLEQGIFLAGNVLINLGLKISFVYLILGLADYLYQKWKFGRDMRMTKQEIKDEYKQSEGDPKIKGKIRQRMLQASQRRMMQELPKADVVITNPTHFAVALKYDPDKYEAPFVLAKGADYLAAKIKDTARENKIEIVENKPLARMLYYNVELGAVVPPELYKAVADILAMVYRMQGKV